MSDEKDKLNNEAEETAKNEEVKNNDSDENVKEEVTASSSDNTSNKVTEGSSNTETKKDSDSSDSYRDRRNDSRGRPGGRKGKFDRGGGKRFFYTKKVCKFCTRQFKETEIDYKNIELVRKYTMPSGKIVPRRINGNCAKHQRMLTAEIKKARILAMLPFVDR